MIERFLPRERFESYEDFKANYRVTVPPRFNFAYDVVDGWALACQTTVAGDVEVRVPPRRTSVLRPYGHAVAEPESLPVSCDWHRNPAVRTFRLDIEPPSLTDNTSDLDRLQRELSRQHGIDQIRAELPLLRDLGRRLRAADWKVAVTLEMRDWVYGTYLPPRLLAVEPREAAGGCYGLAVDLGTTSVVAYLVDFDSVSANFGAYDLVYLMPTFWTRAQRQENDRELRLLERYQQALVARGLSGFSWETLLDDYRLMLTLMIFDPVWDQKPMATGFQRSVEFL